MRVSRWYLLALTCVLLPGLLWADFQSGQAAYQRGDYTTAREIWLSLAEQGDAKAQLKLGQIYRLGEGVPRDYRIATDWFAKAAQQGLSEAQRNIELMIRDGSITAVDAATPSLGSDVIRDIATVAPLVLIAKSTAKKPKSQVTSAPAQAIRPASLETTAPITSTDWLQGLNPQAYVVQLMALLQAQAVEDLLARFQTKLPAIGAAQISSKGQQWHVLLLGPYADKAHAERAYAALPEELKRSNKPWIRRVEAVQAVAF